MAKDTISPKQQKFVDEYLIDFNGTRSALAARYAKRSAGQQASALLKNHKIQSAITAGMKRLARKTDISAERVLRELASVAFTNLVDVVDFKDGRLTISNFSKLSPEARAALSEISETKEGFRVKMHSKIQALELLGKKLGLFSQDQNMNHRFPEGDPFEKALKGRSDEDLKAADRRLDALCAEPAGDSAGHGGGVHGGNGNGNGDGSRPA